MNNNFNLNIYIQKFDLDIVKKIRFGQGGGIFPS